MHLLRALGLLLLLLAVPGARVHAQDAPPGSAFLDRLPRAWCGTFRWEHDSRDQHLAFAFQRVTVRGDGRIEAEGPGLVRYEDEPPEQAVPFRIRAVIDAATRGIELFESIDVPRADYVTNGSHVGELAADLGSLHATWTTRGTGTRGVLRMNARPAGADLAQPCAPPAAQGPRAPRTSRSSHLAARRDPAKFAMH
jgi:hypothetical protein